jgi:DNA-binding transcriptional LysR family regulator
MNLNHLAIFHAVLQEGSISLGAERLHISQPAVSHQLKELEENLHTKLFDRHPRGVRPTEAGVVLSDFARRIFALESSAEVALAELQGLKRGLLGIGASLTTGNYLLPMVLAQFHRSYPGVDVNVDIANTEHVQRRLLDGSLDLGLTEGYVETDELECEVIEGDELVPIAAPDHPIFNESPVTLARLCQEVFVLREYGSGTREVMERAIAAKGFKIHQAMTYGGIEAVKRAIALGTGIGYVSSLAISTELDLGLLRRIQVVDFVVRALVDLLKRLGGT